LSYYFYFSTEDEVSRGGNDSTLLRNAAAHLGEASPAVRSHAGSEEAEIDRRIQSPLPTASPAAATGHRAGFT
jgi:hypothetical protein